MIAVDAIDRHIFSAIEGGEGEISPTGLDGAMIIGGTGMISSQGSGEGRRIVVGRTRGMDYYLAIVRNGIIVDIIIVLWGGGVTPRDFGREVGSEGRGIIWWGGG